MKQTYETCKPLKVLTEFYVSKLTHYATRQKVKHHIIMYCVLYRIMYNMKYLIRNTIFY